MLTREPGNEARVLARAAAHWLALVESGSATEHELAQLQQWRSASAHHENAWQKAQRLKRQFASLPPEVALASLDRPDHSRRTFNKGLLGLAIAAPAGWLTVRELPIDAWSADLSTGTGEQRQVTLSDSSVLKLNTATAVNIDARRQGVALIRGEMAIRRSMRDHFSVTTPYGQAWMGAGEVCARLDEGGCEFSVYAGSLRLSFGGFGTRDIQVGERARVTRQGIETPRTFDLAEPGWREGVLVANDRPLGDFLRDLNRYRPGVLRWDPQLEGLRVTGSFRLGDTDQALKLLAASLPVTVHYRTRYWVSLSPRKKVG